MKKKSVIISAFIGLLLLTGAIYFYVQYVFVFGAGVKTGTLNQIVYKGYLFKTYEGRLVLEGIHSRQAGMVQSNTFDFSVKDPSVAAQLMQADNAAIRAYYSEYKRPLPWRGNSKYVVDSIVILK